MCLSKTQRAKKLINSNTIMEIITDELLNSIVGGENEIVCYRVNDKTVTYGKNVIHYDTIVAKCKEWCIKNGALTATSGTQDQLDYIFALELIEEQNVLYFEGREGELDVVVKGTKYLIEQNKKRSQL